MPSALSAASALFAHWCFINTIVKTTITIRSSTRQLIVSLSIGTSISLNSRPPLLSSAFLLPLLPLSTTTPLHAINQRSQANFIPSLVLIMNATMLVMMMFFSFLLLTPCLGFQQAYKGHDLTSDLAGIELSPNKVRITEAMHTIINTMNKVEKLPSCQKLASQALLNTCSEIDHATSLATDKGIDVMLERSKSIYATRLAICELMDANAVIPASCSPFRPVENDSKFNGFRGFIVNGYFTKPTTQHKFEDHGDLDQCSASLSSNPVWWTSYSNARQNAVLLCHSMRSELDKGKSDCTSFPGRGY